MQQARKVDIVDIAPAAGNAGSSLRLTLAPNHFAGIM
jgi:hypothetical protein